MRNGLKSRYAFTPRTAGSMLAAALGVAFLVSPARADYQWKKNQQTGVAPSGTWRDGAKWDGANNALPGAADTANLVNSSAAYVVTADEDVRVNALNATGLNSKLLISPGKTFEVLTAASVGAGGQMELDGGTWKGPLANLANAGLINVKGDTAAIEGGGSFVQEGALNIVGQANKPAILTVKKNFTNARTITLDSPGADVDANLYMGFDHSVPNASKYFDLTNTGTIVFKEGNTNPVGPPTRRLFRGNLDNRGTIQVDTRTWFLSPRLPVGEPFTIAAGSLHNRGEFAITGRGIEFKAFGKEFKNFPGGTIRGPGIIDVTRLDSGKLENLGGRINPAGLRIRENLSRVEDLGAFSSVAEPTTIIGDYEQLQAGELSIEVDASTSSVQHGQLRVMGDNELGVGGMAYLDADSLVNVTLINSGEFLQVGRQFPILVADVLTLSGGVCPTLATPSTYGVLWSVNCDTPNTVTLRVEAVPEPGTLAFMILGVLPLIAGRVRKSGS